MYPISREDPLKIRPWANNKLPSKLELNFELFNKRALRFAIWYPQMLSSVIHYAPPFVNPV